MDIDVAVVIDVAQLAKFVHEIINARSRRANHLRQRLLVDFAYDGVRPAILAVIRQQQKNSRQPSLAGIEKLVDETGPQSSSPIQNVDQKEFGKPRILLHGASD